MRNRRRLTLPTVVAPLLLALVGCNRTAPPEQRTAPTPAPATEERRAERAAPSAPSSTQAAPATRSTPAAPAARADRAEVRQRREQRRSERVARAFAAGPIDLAEAQRGKAHGRVVEFDAAVEKVLRPDRKGLPHQRFVVRVAGAGTILVAHNTALGGEVPLREGDKLRVRGIYEWNFRGGVVHWTHHDPGGAPDAGWIRTGGKTYQ